VIAILDYGIGNLRSACKALERFAPDVRLVTTAAGASGAAGVVLPGVGAFGPCMDALRSSGLDAVVRAAASEGTPFLGLCIGMQMLYEGSEENQGVAGLGLLPGVVRRLPDGVKRPQMQWNKIWRTESPAAATCPLLEGIDDGAWVYFVHSYAAPLGPAVIATCDYGGPVAAAVQSGPAGALWATQFHPEKSGRVGLALLGNFAARCMVRA